MFVSIAISIKLNLHFCANTFVKISSVFELNRNNYATKLNSFLLAAVINVSVYFYALL